MLWSFPPVKKKEEKANNRYTPKIKQNRPMAKWTVSLFSTVVIFSGMIRFSVAFEFVLFFAIICIQSISSPRLAGNFVFRIASRLRESVHILFKESCKCTNKSRTEKFFSYLCALIFGLWKRIVNRFLTGIR